MRRLPSSMRSSTLPSSLHRLLLFAATASAAQQRQCGCAVIGANASLAANPACPERFRGHDALDAGTAELTVAYLYYRDVAYAARHVAAWNAYDDALLAKLLFLIVDDGSPRDAAADVFAPLAPRGRVVVVRIAEDLAWNVGGARNLASRAASGERLESTPPSLGSTSRRRRTCSPSTRTRSSRPRSWTGRSPTDRPAARSCAASPASSSRRAASIGARTRASSSSRGGPTGPRAAAT